MHTPVDLNEHFLVHDVLRHLGSVNGTFDYPFFSVCAFFLTGDETEESCTWEHAIASSKGRDATVSSACGVRLPSWVDILRSCFVKLWVRKACADEFCYSAHN